MTAEAVLTTLRSHGIDVMTVFLSPSITGLRAGIIAGLGVGAFGRRFMPSGLEAMSPDAAGLPKLPDFGFGLERRRGALSRAVKELAQVLEGHGLAGDAGEEGSAER